MLSEKQKSVMRNALDAVKFVLNQDDADLIIYYYISSINPDKRTRFEDNFMSVFNKTRAYKEGVDSSDLKDTAPLDAYLTTSVEEVADFARELISKQAKKLLVFRINSNITDMSIARILEDSEEYLERAKGFFSSEKKSIPTPINDGVDLDRSSSERNMTSSLPEMTLELSGNFAQKYLDEEKQEKEEKEKKAREEKEAQEAKEKKEREEKEAREAKEKKDREAQEKKEREAKEKDAKEKKARDIKARKARDAKNNRGREASKMSFSFKDRTISKDPSASVKAASYNRAFKKKIEDDLVK